MQGFGKKHFWPIIVISAVWVLVSWLVSHWWVGSSIDSLAETLQQALNNKALYQKQQISSYLARTHHIPESLGEENRILKALSSPKVFEESASLSKEERKRLWSENPEYKEINAYLAKLIDYTKVSVIYILDAAGNCLLSSNAETKTSFVGSNYSTRDYYAGVIKSGSGYQYAMGRVTNLPGLFFSSGIWDNGKLVGVAVVKINLDDLQPWVRDVGSLLIDEYGVIIQAYDKQLELNAIVENGVDPLPHDKRLKRYKVSDFPLFKIEPWETDLHPLLHRLPKQDYPTLVKRQQLEYGLELISTENVQHLSARSHQVDSLSVFAALALFGLLFQVLWIWRRSIALTREHNQLLLRESEARFRQAQNVAHVGSFDWNPVNGQLWWSDEHYRLWGIEPQSVQPSYEVFRQRVHPDDVGQMEKALTGALQEGGLYNCEHRVLLPNGEEHYIHAMGEAQFDEQGKAVRMIGTVQDITPRKLAEQQLIKSESRFRSLFEHTDAIAVQGYDKNRRVIYWNHASEKLYGYTMEEAIGKQLEDLIIPDFMREKVIADVADWVNGGPAIPSSELTLHHADGSDVEVYSSHVMLHNTSNEPEMYCLDVDLNQIKLMEIELRKLAMAVEQNPESIVITDVNGVIEYVNQHFVDQTGYTLEEAIGKTPGIIKSGKTPVAVYDDLWSTLKQGLPWEGEFINKSKEGKEFIEYAQILPLVQDSGAITHYVAIKEDITEKKRIAEELDAYRQDLELMVVKRTSELEKANAAKSEFLANMSHELRTPMHAILSFAGMGKEKIDRVPKERLLRYFSNILESGDRLLALLNDLLDLSKLEAGRIPFDMGEHDLHMVVDAAAAELKELLAEKSQILEVGPTAVNTVACFDANKMLQVVRNLLSNAIKFTPEGKRIRVSLDDAVLPVGYRSTDVGTVPAISLSVSDQGVGIPEGELEAVFDKFVQSSKTRSGAGGTGLGLAICKEIIEGHGGKIQAANNSEGGAVFTFIIPISNSEI